MKKKILTILLCGITMLGVTGCGKKEQKIEKPTITFQDNLNFEINSEIALYSLIKDTNGSEIITEDKNIDTSTLGEHEIEIAYKKEEKEYNTKLTIKIVDTTAPIIEYKKELKTTEGTKIDLLKDVNVTDNSNEKINVEVEGEYDLNKEGTYNLKYIAVDSSNNKTEEAFTLKVNKKVVKYIKVGNNKLYFGKYKLEGDIPSNYTGTITIKADGTATSTGYYYSSKGNFEKKKLTGKWGFSEDSVGGLVGAPDENIKVDGIYFSWSNGDKSGFGLGDKYFGDQFHGYSWYSY